MTIDLGYTIQGRGGQALCWLDTAGGAPWSALANYNFALMPAGNWAGVTSGSFLLSTPFAMGSGQKLTVIATLATAHYEPFWDVGFALLVQGSSVQEILFALRPDGVDQNGDMGPNVFYAKPSAGVTVTPVVQGPANVVLGGISYGPPINAGSGSVSTVVTAVCAPAAGTYQILFGMFNTNATVDVTRPSALIVQFVDAR